MNKKCSFVFNIVVTFLLFVLRQLQAARRRLKLTPGHSPHDPSHATHDKYAVYNTYLYVALLFPFNFCNIKNLVVLFS